MHIILANPRGFCAGVNMAIESLDRSLELFGRPLYVYHEIVHNRPIVERFRGRGVVFVDDISEVPDGGTVLYSAHGVSPVIRQQSAARNLRAIDATCPLVTKVHAEVASMAAKGLEIIMIGHAGHPEVEGTMGQATSGMYLVESELDVAKLRVRDENKLAYVTQTTLSVDDASKVVAALQARFPAIRGPKRGDICYATQNRQDAVKFMAPQCDLVIVVGSPTSSNSNRLREVADKLDVEAYMIDNANELKAEWLQGKRSIGISAGASAPEVLVEAVIARLKQLGAKQVRELEGSPEAIVFPVPKALADIKS